MSARNPVQEPLFKEPMLTVSHGPSPRANDLQVGGNHYKSHAIQPWDFIAQNNLGFFEGNIVKYVVRWRAKSGIDDLRKARHYLDKLIELNTPDPTK